MLKNITDYLANAKVGKGIVCGLIAPLSFAYVIGCGNDSKVEQQAKPTGAVISEIKESSYLPKEEIKQPIREELPKGTYRLSDGTLAFIETKNLESKLDGKIIKPAPQDPQQLNIASKVVYSTAASPITGARLTQGLCSLINSIDDLVVGKAHAQDLDDTRIEFAQYVNKPPVLRLKINPRQGNSPLTVVGDVSSSYDPDGNINNASVYWDFNGDGSFDIKTSGIEDKPKFTYYSPGKYTVVVNMKDENRANTTKTVQVAVLENGRVTTPSANYSGSSKSAAEDEWSEMAFCVGGFNFDGGKTQFAFSLDTDIGWTETNVGKYLYGGGVFITVINIAGGKGVDATSYNYGLDYIGNFWLGDYEKKYAPFFLGGLILNTTHTRIDTDTQKKSFFNTYPGVKLGGGIKVRIGGESSDESGTGGIKLGIYDNIIVANSLVTNNIEFNLGYVLFFN